VRYRPQRAAGERDLPALDLEKLGDYEVGEGEIFSTAHVCFDASECLTCFGVQGVYLSSTCV